VPFAVLAVAVDLGRAAEVAAASADFMKVPTIHGTWF
jgi:hypothetical protein